MDRDVDKIVRKHVEAFFAGHRVARREFDRGPIQSVAPGCHTLAVSPGPKTAMWNYVSVGGVLVTKTDRPATEFLIISQDERSEHVERLAMTVHYCHTQTLGLGHTFPLPDGDHGHILRILPITSAEREFKKEHGLDAHEEQFERAALPYWDVSRASVV